jgi:micrococcal nuclease
MIGLDTPESVDPRKPVQCFALEASARAKTILGGQSVYLETDPSRGEYTYDLPYRYQQDFRAAEDDDARTHERGLWSPSACAA